LGDIFEGMMMALGALHTNAKENLTSGFSPIVT